MADQQFPEIAAALAYDDLDSVISLVRDAFDEDSGSAIADPVVAGWIARRYRYLFFQEVLNDPIARRAAEVPMPLQLIDNRSTRELVAHRFLREGNDASTAIDESQPEPQIPAEFSTTLVFVPGLMTGLLPAGAFQSVWPEIEDRFNLHILIADIHPLRSAEANAVDIAQAVESGRGLSSELDTVGGPRAQHPEDVVLLGYSKGAVDSLEFLLQYPSLAPKIRALIGWAGAFGGSHVVDSVAKRFDFEADEDQTKDPLRGSNGRLLRQIVPVVQLDRATKRLDEYEPGDAIRDLTTNERAEFWAEHADDIDGLNIPVLTFAGRTSVRDVPYYQAISALQLKGIDRNNDMFVTDGQARVPLRHTAHVANFRAHHWDLAYDPFPWLTAMGSSNVDHKFARVAAVSALVTLLAELGLIV